MNTSNITPWLVLIWMFYEYVEYCSAFMIGGYTFGDTDYKNCLALCLHYIGFFQPRTKY